MISIRTFSSVSYIFIYFDKHVKNTNTFKPLLKLWMYSFTSENGAPNKHSNVFYREVLSYRISLGRGHKETGTP